MFELKSPTTVRLTNLVCRVEAAGKRKDVPAVTLRLKLEGVQNTMLDLISPTARSTFFAPIEGQEQLPGVEPSTPILRSKDIKHWTPEEIAFQGWKVRIDHGIDEADPIALDKCKVDGFTVDLYEGGHIDMEFKVSTSDIDSEGVGILWSSQKQQFPVTIIAPEIPKPAIDGSVEAFKKDHPEFDENAAGDLFAAGASDGAFDNPADPLAGDEIADDDSAHQDAGDQSSDVSSDDATREQAELEAGMRESIQAAGVAPKGRRGRKTAAVE